MNSYTELSKIPDFLGRFEYVKLKASIPGTVTFGSNRYFNQNLYHSYEWRKLRNFIIARDDGMDLGAPDRPIAGRIIIHHICPLTIEDFELHPENIWDPENLICVSHNTHEAIHFGSEDRLFKGLIERKANDQSPWKGGRSCGDLYSIHDKEDVRGFS